MTKKQKIAELEKHLADLREEAKAVEELIAQIKKEKQITILKKRGAIAPLISYNLSPPKTVIFFSV